MRAVAIGTIFCHRLMLKKERPALFRMAAVAGFDNGVFLHHGRARRAVGIVAIGADHLADLCRVGGHFFRLRPLLLVAGKANLGLGLFHHHLVCGRMRLVAIIAGKLVVLVLAAIPVIAGFAGMAGQALA